MKNEYLAAAIDELRAVGIYEHKVMGGGKHIKLMWHHKEHVRLFTLPCTPSDVRGIKNSRADLRRILRADGLLVTDEQPAAPKPLSLEQRVRNLENRLKQLESRDDESRCDRTPEENDSRNRSMGA